jgi:hypothetical protein
MITPFGEGAAFGADYAGYATFLVPDLGQLMLAFQDKEYIEKIKPDEENFMDQGATLMVVAGLEEVYIDGGEITELGLGI